MNMKITPKVNFVKWFELVICLVFQVMLLFIILVVLVGTVKLFLNLGHLITAGNITEKFLHMVSDVLTLFVLIELSRSLVEYFSSNRLRLTFILDAGIVFVLREMMIKLFENHISTDQIYALTALMLVLGIMRTAAVIVFQREKAMLSVTSGSVSSSGNTAEGCPVFREKSNSETIG
ncbi:MAG: phosphate-starvation-inducible PsiE family protein [Magnetococcales bacterium]|nr:phosphate-starvation-inducible PsiE family protein [Magnetococcales bacterium]